MRKLPLSRLDEFFAALSGAYGVYLPATAQDGRAHYTRWSEGVQYDRSLNTVRSAKDCFFPQTENLVDFKLSGKSIEIVDTRVEGEDFIVFGVRACDVRSFDVLDRVFLAEPADSYYAERREKGVLFSMACTRPAETCFCHTFGIDPAEPGGDVACYIEDDTLYLSALTEKGEKALSAAAALLEESDDSAANAQKALIRERIASLPLYGLTTEGFGGDKTDALFDRPEWKKLSEACLGCGTCTFVCPTCQCYDIRDFKTNQGVRRYRCWDSCMYSEFTKMSAGQPRLTQTERFRQRFMHKLVYYPANN
ncbi:MAG: 4Fe-4S dicluster domain-containing protein, partial [Oscillospiraceae bacterium]|nr:4Fe-4S dicluster domain-containing protein [Oscillospiraceae bacterium]